MSLPDQIKIDDITTGKIDPQLIYAEIDRLKLEINILRNDMAQFIRALAKIPPEQSQSEYFQIVHSRLTAVQQSINDYCDKYNKLLPIINLAQIKLGHDVEAPPPVRSNGSTASNTLNNTPVINNKTTPVIPNNGVPGRLNGNGSTNSPTPPTNGTPGGANKKRANSIKKK
ncbi:uncharacterized protein SPAPADRAFT_58804 [Spathaspora passalidarum NRRL Y-27907]|uniref:Uncharacterized protein n=1 Tax=Spathaspora passalidarum (strain NRRL Y-27907 / 11-Y1) TaxID=619300 RepID=G3AE48_SPAPN|nr:uncharacterized protein SPAPADRAFT_58804 [Spathaspora passalidarum NRRL Y-27907]EGW35582.1 hypothetical protein SPAPADRAFT_58804 [Spathaspora passalidarum NRRL Y-27907]